MGMSAGQTGGRGTRGHRRRGRHHRMMSEINVTPFVDVMLVLLVIFMVAAPMMQQGFEIQLPKSAQNRALKTQPITVAVPISFRKDQRVQLNSEAVRLDLLSERVRQELTGRASQDVVLSADGQITYQEVITVMDRLMQGGVSNVNMQTQPLAGRTP